MKKAAVVFVFLLGLAYAGLYWFLVAPIFGANEPMLIVKEPSAAELRAHVAALTSFDSNRSIHHPEALTAAALYIESQLEEMGYEFYQQPVPIKGVETFNIITRFVPEGAEQKGPWIIVGAHYDAALEDNPGADDNASGVAGLLALAKMLKENPSDLAYPVEMVFYTTEEPPYFATKSMGSEIHAQAVEDAGREVRMMFSLEMIGYYSDEPGSQHFPASFLNFLYSTTGDYIGIIGLIFDNKTTREVKRSFRAIQGLKSHSINAPKSLKGIDFSDHKNYWSRGWPAVMITDTAFLRNDQYHQPGDTPDRLNYQTMALVVQAMFQTLNDLD